MCFVQGTQSKSTVIPGTCLMVNQSNQIVENVKSSLLDSFKMLSTINSTSQHLAVFPQCVGSHFQSMYVVGFHNSRCLSKFVPQFRIQLQISSTATYFSNYSALNVQKLV